MIDLTTLGIRAVRMDQSSCTIAMPKLYVSLGLEDAQFADATCMGIHLMRRFEQARGQLFCDVMGHIAKHDRSPLDRLEQLERFAVASLPSSEWADNPAQAELRRFVKLKSGAASWSLSGYGKESTTS